MLFLMELQEFKVFQKSCITLGRALHSDLLYRLSDITFSSISKDP